MSTKNTHKMTHNSQIVFGWCIKSDNNRKAVYIDFALACHLHC